MSAHEQPTIFASVARQLAGVWEARSAALDGHPTVPCRQGTQDALHGCASELRALEDGAEARWPS